MKKLFLITILLVSHVALAQKAFARSIISGISTNEIDIDTKFNGTEILLFGAKGEAGNIVVAVRGPKKNFLVTKKERLLGIWYNGERVKFKDSLSYYSLFSTFSDDRTTNQLLSELELGTGNLKFIRSDNFKLTEEEKNDFQLQLVNKLEKGNLYTSGANKIEFLDESLFKVILKFPKNIARGVYTVEIYLVNEDDLVSFQSIPIYVNQVGISATISDQSYQQPVLYGLLSVIMALVIGWLANYLFVRFIAK